MCESRSSTTSWPARVWLTTETTLPMVPEATKRPASFPSRSAAMDSSRLAVGSSSRPSAPTSARAMASRISGVGRVRVSERRSAMSCTGVSSPQRCGLQALGGTPAPFRMGELTGKPSQEFRGFGVLPLPDVDLGEEEERLGDDEGVRMVAQHRFQARSRRGRVAVGEVIRGDPDLLLREPATTDVDLGQAVGGVAAVRIVLHELLELLEGFLSETLILLDGFD